jgi:hypothetical protein
MYDLLMGVQGIQVGRQVGAWYRSDRGLGWDN